MNLQTVPAEDVLNNNPEASIFLILFIAPNGHHYAWGTNGFTITAIDEFNGFFDLKGVMRANALKQYYEASSNAKNLPFTEGRLELVPLPRFEV